MPLRKIACLVAVLLCTALLTSGCASGHTCPNFQSPRNLNRSTQPPPVYGTSPYSFVVGVGPDTIEYRPQGGSSQTLHRCSQHYHYPIEDPQGCPGELPPRGRPGTQPPAGEWVEVHTAYAARVAEVCLDPESTKCCLEQPVVVRAFNAKVIAGPGGPIVEPGPTERPLFEWSGSTTGPDYVANECKGPALWSFRLSCDITVSVEQLSAFRHPEDARRPQTGDRLSRDLTLVQP